MVIVIFGVLVCLTMHYNDVIMSAMVSQITSLTSVYSTVYSRYRSKKTKLRVTGLCDGNSRWPVNSPHKGPVTRKMFPFDDVIMNSHAWGPLHELLSTVPSHLCRVTAIYLKIGRRLFCHQGPRLLTWFNFNLLMDKQLYLIIYIIKCDKILLIHGMDT